jgi:hypothetical protein
MNSETNPEAKTRSSATSDPADERAGNLGCGIGLLVAGLFLIADRLDWIDGSDWVLPAVVLGLAANYLYKAFSRGRG